MYLRYGESNPGRL
ncbi:hypothetical protein AYI68_g6618, partial [Smittium mucronatum]